MADPIVLEFTVSLFCIAALCIGVLWIMAAVGVTTWWLTQVDNEKDVS